MNERGAAGAAAPGRTGGFGAPGDDGWALRPASALGEFVDLFGEMRVRAEAPGKARLRIGTHRGFVNIAGTIHGGLMLALVDQALFVGPAACGVAILGGVTVDVTSQFLAPGAIGPPLDAVTEIMRETRRMLFVRGVLEQEGVIKLAFSGTLRKSDGAR